MIIYCCGCQKEIEATLTNGKEIYPRRPDLWALPFWKCPACSNYVGCHHKTKDRTKPLGCIPTPEIKNARRHIHTLLDSLWKTGKIRRKELYARLSKELGYEYHTANIRDIGEARKIYKLVKRISK